MKVRKTPNNNAPAPVVVEENSPYYGAAIEIARQLVAEAVAAPEGITWHGDDLIGESEEDITVIHGPVDSGVYSGVAGIAWFLAHAGVHTGEKSMLNAAVKSIDHALSNASRALDRTRMSLSSGAVGIALTAFEIADRLGEPRLKNRALSLARAAACLARAGELPEETDLIGGIAGIVIGLLAIHRAAPDPALLDATRVACNRLLETRSERLLDFSASDARSSERAPALCGMAHGASGIGWALAEAALAMGEERFRSAADEAFMYERSWFSPERCGWPDLRRFPSSSDAATEPAWTVAWCHGALGIGSVRLRLYEFSREPAPLSEAGAAIHAARLLVSAAGSSLRSGHLSDVTLCHGIGGAAELMLLAYEVTGLEEHRRAARRVGDLCLEIYRANEGKWTSGLRGAERVPGLFVGLAGIGTTMLRLHDISLIGSPLLPGRQAVVPTSHIENRQESNSA